jgi:protein dithiol oxidoreductase (disulfide-forming)
LNMRLRHLSLLLGLSLVLGACGKQESTASRTASRTASNAPAPTAAPATNSVTSAATSRQKASESDKPATMTRYNEDGSETVEETSGDSGTHNPLLAAVAATVAAATPSASAANLSGPSLWQEGVNYMRLVPSQPTAVPAGQVEVLEFFWYACPHCYALEPMVESWEKSKPNYVAFARVHVEWNEGHRSLARLYYTLETMAKLKQVNLERVHKEVFKEIHVNGDPLIGPDPSNAAAAERVQMAFIKTIGIPEAEFSKAYHGFDVETAMQRADELVLRYHVSGVPTFVVNGKFVADVASAGSPEKLISLVGDLAAQEHKH